MKKKQDLLLYAMLAAVLVGTALGSFTRVLHPAWGIWDSWLIRQGMAEHAAAFGEQLLTCCAGLLFWTGILAAAGLSVLGMPAAFAVMLFRGCAVGAVLAELYRQTGWRGVPEGILFVLPFAVTGTGLLLLAARECSRSAGQLWTGITGKDGERFSIVLYGIRFGVLLLGVLLLALVQSGWMLHGYPLWQAAWEG